MPSYKKNPTARPVRTAAPAHKPGSKSPKHRGFRPAEASAAPVKKRWNADDRAKRSEAAASGKRPHTDHRPDWQPNGTRPERNDRSRFNSHSRVEPRNDRDDRSARVEPRNSRDEPRNSRVEPVETRPRYSRDVADRPRRDSERPARTSYQTRPDRADRPSYQARPDRGDRPARDDRSSRSEPRNSRVEPVETRPRHHSAHSDRPTYQARPDRSARPARDDRRPEWQPRAERTERPAHNDRRPSYDSRQQREERPRRDSDFYPSKDATTRYTAHEDVVLEKLEAEAIQASDVVGVTFADLGLGGNIVRELAALGAASPFPIQAATIPDVLKGMDVLGRGKTGSGKTIAFGAPLVERLMENGGAKGRKPGRRPRALILAPTRELALQIDRTIQPIARSVGLFTTQIYGGVPQHRQVTALQRGVDIVIGTPGRIEDLIDQGRLDLSDVTITVLDEADHMCDLGFLEPVQRILNETAPDGQKLLFSATLDKGVAALVDEFLVNPSVHEVAGEDQAHSTIDHRVLLIEQSDKRAIIEQLASGDGKTLIFARTRAFAEQLADELDDAGIPAVSLHGDLNQARRTRNLEKLTSGRVKVLVATDVAARGIHVDDISLVIQADPPDEYKSYLHRAGRTGRAGKVGTVVTLVNNRRRRKMDELLGRAEITPSFDHVRPGDKLIGELAAL
ncbi:MAG TPA: DEAD/DEAH box helicase [Terrimesophilobacter sp.]|uniref:DEAD/DEAH box helicase n=1 Tax=Terrimesophilobacter sp. TaxID=2906435 RepID=UPI002F9282A1